MRSTILSNRFKILTSTTAKQFIAAIKTNGSPERAEKLQSYFKTGKGEDDVSAPRVVGGYLFDKPRDVLYRLARSKNLWERRIAILSTAFFIQHGDLDDTYRIAEMLLDDDQDLIHKATGWLLREAGKKDPDRLHAFLKKYAPTMPRTALRYSIERLDKVQRERYLAMKKKH